jgi:hypothetical protein
MPFLTRYLSISRATPNQVRQNADFGDLPNFWSGALVDEIIRETELDTDPPLLYTLFAESKETGEELGNKPHLSCDHVRSSCPRNSKSSSRNRSICRRLWWL